MEFSNINNFYLLRNKRVYLYELIVYGLIILYEEREEKNITST